MLFRDLPVVDMKDALKTVSAAKGIVFVSAKGVDGVKMPLKEARVAATKSIGSEAVFVPVTDSWKSPTDVLAKDLALQLKEDTKSPYPIILSVGKDRYEKFSDKEVNKKFEGNAVVVLHAAPTDKKKTEFLAFHHKTREVLGEAKEPKLFPEHIMTVMEVAKKLPKTPKLFLDAGAGFMIFDQARHYLDTGVVSAVLAMNATLAKSEKMTIPYVYDNAELMGVVEELKGVGKVITKGDGTAAEETLPPEDEGVIEGEKTKTKSKSKSGDAKPKSKSKSKSASKK